MKEEILNWLRNGQDWNDGVALYAKYGHNKTVLKNFIRKETKDRKQKLAYKLVVKCAGFPDSYITMNVNKLPKGETKPRSEALEDRKTIAPKDTSSASVSENHETAAKAYKGKILFKNLPEEVQIMIVKRSTLEKERTKVHAKLDKVPKTNTAMNNRARKGIGSEVDKITGEINSLNTKIKYYEDNSRLPEEPKSLGIMERLLQIGQDIRNAGSRRSKLRALINGTSKKPAIPEGPKKKASEKKLKKETLLIEKLQREQNELNNA